MTKSIAAIALMCLALASPGRAADLPAKAAQLAAPAWPSWAGGYGGVSAGYGWNPHGTDVAGVVFGDSPSGMTAGLRMGYDWLAGPLVIGIETDASLSGFDSTAGAGALSIQNASRWWGSTNLRLGVPAFGDHWLPYVIGGLAYGGAKTAFQAPTFSAGLSDVRAGWNIGGGLEVRITPHVSAFAEFRYMDIGSLSVPLAPAMVGTQPQTVGIAQGGLNYRF